MVYYGIGGWFGRYIRHKSLNNILFGGILFIYYTVFKAKVSDLRPVQHPESS